MVRVAVKCCEKKGCEKKTPADFVVEVGGAEGRKMLAARTARTRNWAGLSSDNGKDIQQKRCAFLVHIALAIEGVAPLGSCAATTGA